MKETSLVSLEHWTESVFRFFVVRRLLRDHAATCQTEWNRVDLVLRDAAGAHLVEFKFFASHPLVDHKGRTLRRKGGAGPQNFAEFQEVVGKMQASRSARWASACGSILRASVVLAYADPQQADGSRTFRSYYDSLAPDDRILAVTSVCDAVPAGGGHTFTCKLLDIRLA